MAFLDNSGDIILDAVLTDLGRMKMAEGDFSISKFAIGDDEVDYGLYDINHVSGSAYYDLKIMQTPVLEAFTNNTSVLKSNLMSMEGAVLYLPVLKINTKSFGGTTSAYVNESTSGGDFFLVIYDETTKEFLDGTSKDDGDTTAFEIIGGAGKNYLNAIDPSAMTADGHICVDQGLDTPDISPTRGSYMASSGISLDETEFQIEIDNRLGVITSAAGLTLSAGPSDDDHLSAYIVGASAPTMDALTYAVISESEPYPGETPIQGPRGHRVRFKISTALTELEGNDNLLDKLGKTLTSATSTTMFGSDITAAATTYKYVDTTVRVRGMITGYSIDVPVRFLKKTL